MWRWSFHGVRKLRENLKSRFAFQQWNKGWSWNKKLKKALIWISLMPETHWRYVFHKQVKSWDFKTWFRFWQFRTPAWKRYLQMHLLAERFVFSWWWSYLSNFISVFTSIVYGIYWRLAVAFQRCQVTRKCRCGGDKKVWYVCWCRHEYGAVQRCLAFLLCR